MFRDILQTIKEEIKEKRNRERERHFIKYKISKIILEMTKIKLIYLNSLLHNYYIYIYSAYF